MDDSGISKGIGVLYHGLDGLKPGEVAVMLLNIFII